METEISFSVLESHLLVSLAGKYPALELKELLTQIRNKADDCQRTEILIDAILIEAPRSEMERYVVGEMFAALFRTDQRIAVVYRPELINRFAENVAVNRGAQLAVFDSVASALPWLLWKA
jgi:hypothetical protein